MHQYPLLSILGYIRIDPGAPVVDTPNKHTRTPMNLAGMCRYLVSIANLVRVLPGSLGWSLEAA